MKPEITVITPVYNGEKYLAEVIESVLSQENIVIEYIIVNDGSSDGSLDIARSFQEKNPSIIQIIDQKKFG